MITDADRHKLVVEWNDTTTDYPKDKCIHHLFEEQVARTPDAIAVIFDDIQLTYRELNTRANQLAHYLQALGTGPETLVGLCVERSPAMIVGLLGILKAGGAYLPIDPNYPADRIRFMLADAAIPIVISQTHLCNYLATTTAKCIWLDQDGPLIATHATHTPNSPVQSTQLAYVIYTSGSTGQPKGVQALHQAAVNRFAWMWRTMPFALHEVCCQKTSLSFVDSVWEIFGPLLQGVPSVIIPDIVVKDPAAFIKTLQCHKVTRLVLVPSLLRTMLAHETQLQDRLPHLTHWICSGEVLSIELTRQFYAQMPNARLFNLYGSSEVAADATWYDTSSLQDAANPAYTSIPIGQPIDNIQCYILDSAQQLAPLGVQGELYIGGDGLARGYHQRPDLTNERFIPNPFGPGRLFKTGDLARWTLAPTPASRPTIEFLGRADNQVKLRGFRIELGEIEAVLTQHPAVQEAVVVVREDVPSEKRLVAYVVADKVTGGQGDRVNDDEGGLLSLGIISGSPVTLSNLRGYLQQTLPDYMLPSAYVLLNALPLTPNGKVDRIALPAPDVADWRLMQPYVAPQTASESALATIWSAILRVDQVGMNDNFFELGGHSLLATQVASRLNETFGVEIPLRTLFEQPTIAGLAIKIEAAIDASIAELSDEEADQLLQQLVTTHG